MPVPLRVVSVERSLFEGDVDFIVANGADGELGVLPRHAALMTILKPGALKIVQGTEELFLFVGGGFLEVLPDRVTVLADVAEHAEDISIEQAEAASELVAHADRLRGARIVFDLPTVTGTENILLAAVRAQGRTEIFNAAREPHVQDLCQLLGKMGARIEGIGTERLVVDGMPELGGAEHTVVPDYLEAGTYAIAAVAAGGELRLECSRPEDLNIVLLKLEQAGARVEVGDGWFRVGRRQRSKILPTDMSTWPYPGFPTDLQAQFMALMTQADGETVISEYVHENRFQHVNQLAKMGASISVEGRLHAFVHGPCPLKATELAVPDIRSGAALVIAALCADGESVLHNAWHVARGYEDMTGKLTAVGAQIESVAVEADPSAGSRTYE